VKVLGAILGFAVVSSLLGGLAFFAYYSLNIYKPTGHVACTGSTVSRQTDVAIHVVRQWFGKEQNLYAPCPGQTG